MQTNERLSEWLGERGITQRFAAKKIGASYVTLSRWINGHAVPDARFRAAIEEYTGGDIKAGDWA